MHASDGRTDRHSDGRTDGILIARPRLHSMQRGKKVVYFFGEEKCTLAEKILATPMITLLSLSR